MKDLYSVAVGGKQAWLATYGLPRTKRYTISQVFVPVAYRRAGLGTWLLEKAIEDADREGVVLRLMAAPDDALPGMDEEQLVAWYRRHGFVPLGTGWTRSMERRPQ